MVFNAKKFTLAVTSEETGKKRSRRWVRAGVGFPQDGSWKHGEKWALSFVF